uniref:Uncharacterized protein n=2 Tax=Caedibacter taeniospiralis TaxID=28907 RepID=Q6TFF3_CAETA|nr:hypothetical protein [Caedibacter taeniospiralis]
MELFPDKSREMVKIWLQRLKSKTKIKLFGKGRHAYYEIQ